MISYEDLDNIKVGTILTYSAGKYMCRIRVTHVIHPIVNNSSVTADELENNFMTRLRKNESGWSIHSSMYNWTITSNNDDIYDELQRKLDEAHK